MELFYLWVEDYKNIKNQGFNFSPRFKCSYDEESKKLTINENKNHLENFFGKNINITAIVGENGSGKSRILECIEKVILSNGEQEACDFKYILIYDDKKLFYMSNIKIDTLVEKKTAFNHVCTLAYRYHVSDGEIHQALYFSSANLRYLTLEKQGIVNILSAKQNDMHPFHISSFMYEPIKVEISLKSYDKLIQEHISFLSFKMRAEIEEILKNITDLYHKYLSILYIRQRGTRVDAEILTDKELLLQNINTPLSKDNFSDFFISVLRTKEFKLSELSKEQKDIYFRKGYWHYFEFDFIDEKERRYNHLSHGEKVIFSQLLSIFFYINKNKKLLFLFDEPDIALHPNWQKQYLNEVINLLQKIPRKYHFIFTTHSPFLLSDLPKENIIFLEKEKETGKCINDTKKIDINPFGANIHTLLSHGFFMKDGLMGEFAKSKIDEVIRYLKLNEESTIQDDKKAKSIIDIIGEPILKNTLQTMYDAKVYKDESKLDTLKRKREKIEEAIKQEELNEKN